MHPFDVSTPLGEDFRDALTLRISSFLSAQSQAFTNLGTPVATAFELARTFTSGGKRIRPAFCYWSYVAAGGNPESPGVLDAAASLDLLHVSALVHDDVLDSSDLRRGIPAAHVQYQIQHDLLGGTGSAPSFGLAGAVLLGDLLLGLSAELFDQSEIEQFAKLRAMKHLHAVRTEVVLGQMLDVWLQSIPPDSADEQLAAASQVCEYKTAKYSVQRPCQIGASLAAADQDLESALAAFGSPLGRAFQLRDDILGVFGDPGVTGKPAGDDIREGKRTILMAVALSEATPIETATLTRIFGNHEANQTDIELARGIIESSGARNRVENQINELHSQAMAALDGANLTVAGRTALTRLAELSIRRDN